VAALFNVVLFIISLFFVEQHKVFKMARRVLHKKAIYNNSGE